MPRQKKIEIVVPDITSVEIAEEQIAKAHALLQSNILGGILLLKKIIEYSVAINHLELQAKGLSILHLFFAHQRNVSKQVRHWVKVSEEVLKQLPDTTIKAELHFRLCPYFTATGQKQKAVFHYQQSEKIYCAKSKMPSGAYITVAQMFLEIGEYEQGWQALIKAEEQLCEEIELSKATQKSDQEQQKFAGICAYCCGIWCAYCMVLSDLIMHYEYALAGEKFIQHFEFMPVKVNILGAFADSAIAHNDTARITELAQQLNQIYVQYKIHIVGVQSYLLFAVVSNEEKDFERTLFYAHQALDIAKKYCDKAVRILPSLRIAETLLLMDQDYQYIEALLDECGEILQQLKTPFNRKKYLQLRILWAEKTQQYHLLPEYIRSIFALPQPEYYALLREKFYQDKINQTKSFLQQTEQQTFSLKSKHYVGKSNNILSEQKTDKNVVKQANTFSTPDILHAVRTTVADLATHLLQLNERTAQKKLQKLSKILDENISEPELLKSIEQELHSVHSEYLLQLAKKYSSLTHTELRISVFLRLNLSTHQIAAIMGISPDTVYTHRKSIRKKVGISHRKSLNMFLLTLQDV